jgi:hypothetical protein
VRLPADLSLYAVAYQPLHREGGGEVSIWHSRLALGQALPLLPLALRADLIIPVNFESRYAEVCQHKRLTPDDR